MIVSRRVILNGWRHAWKNACRRRNDFASQTTGILARTNHLHLIYYQHTISSSFSTSSDDDQFVVEEEWNPAPSKGHWRSNHSPKAKFGRVVATESQMERNKRIAKFGSRNHWLPILKIYQSERHHFGLTNYSFTLARLAKAGTFKRDNPVLPALLLSVDRYIAENVIDADHYTIICHSIAKLQAQHDPAKNILANLFDPTFAQEFLETANRESISNLAWGLGRLQRSDLMHSLQSQMSEPCIKSLFTPGGVEYIADIARAYAAVAESSPPLFEAIEERADWIVTNGQPKDLSNLAWACGTLGVPSPAFFAALENRANWLVTTGNPQAISNTAWACAKLGHLSPQLFYAITKRWEWLIDSSNRREEEYLKWAFDELGHPIPK